jgi:hypothetical protein
MDILKFRWQIRVPYGGQDGEPDSSLAVGFYLFAFKTNIILFISFFFLDITNNFVFVTESTIRSIISKSIQSIRIIDMPSICRI